MGSPIFILLADLLREEDFALFAQMRKIDPVRDWYSIYLSDTITENVVSWT